MSKYVPAHRPDGSLCYCHVDEAHEGYTLFEYGDPAWGMPYKHFHEYTWIIYKHRVYFYLFQDLKAGLWFLECYGAMCYTLVGDNRVAFWWGDVP